jgi:hypothetical protein
VERCLPSQLQERGVHAGCQLGIRQYPVSQALCRHHGIEEIIR